MAVSFTASTRSIPRPGPALVGHRGIDEAVGDHRRPPGQRRPDHLTHQLRPGGGVEQRLGPGQDLRPRIEQQLADPLAGGGAARLAHGHHLAAVGQQRVGEQCHLGRLARTVESLERDEHPAMVVRPQKRGTSCYPPAAMGKTLIIAEKPSVGQDYAKALRGRLPKARGLPRVRRPDRVLGDRPPGRAGRAGGLRRGAQAVVDQDPAGAPREVQAEAGVARQEAVRRAARAAQARRRRRGRERLRRRP